jgi:hypothetical protein
VRGGGGNFGIVTSFEFRLHPVGPLVIFCAPVYPAEHAGKIIRSWRDFMATAPDEFGGTLVEFSTIPAVPDYPQEAWGTRVVTVATVYAGPADEGEQVVQPLRELGEPIIDFSGQMSYCAVQTLFDPLFPKGKHQCYWKSLYLDNLGDEVIDAVVSRAANPPSKLTFASLWYLGGAPSRVSADATAFGDRVMARWSVEAIHLLEAE